MIADGKEATVVGPGRSRISSTLHEGGHARSPAAALGGVRPPVVIVKLPVVDAAGAPTHRCDVRLVRSAREASAEKSWDSDGGEVTAVVILRDVTPSRVTRCVRAATRGGASISPELLGQLLPMGDGKRRDPASRS